MLSITYKTDSRFIFVNFVIHALRLITPLTSVLGLKLILDALTKRSSFTAVIIITAIYCSLNMSKAAAEAWYNNKYLPIASAKISESLDIRLMMKTVGLDLIKFDDAEFYNKYMRAKNEINSRAVSVVTTLCEIAGCLFSIATLFTIILFIEPVLLLCVAGGVVLSLILDIIRSKYYYKFNLETTPAGRRIGYIQRIFYEPQYLKELRLFGVGGLGIKKYKASTAELIEILKRHGKIKFMIALTGILLESGIFVFTAFIYLGWRVFVGALGIGDFSAMYSAVFQFGGELYDFVGKFTALYQHSLFIDNLAEVMNTASVIGDGGTMQLDASAAHSIEFRHVSFSYKQGQKILDNVSFTAEAGRKLAIVGYNGAGKSTLVKLITRLYDPDEGSIFIDGADIREYTIKSLRTAFGVVMQDFQHYAFSLAENINPELCRADIGDEKNINQALCKAGLREKVARLPYGIDSALTKEFDSDGVVLSGGEFQKLSFARACAMNSHVLILDEVSSALDPIAENELNDIIFSGSDDKTVIIISHRLSAARASDKIIMLESGRLIEEGTHDSLMNLGGQYAAMFSLQSKKYA